MAARPARSSTLVKPPSRGSFAGHSIRLRLSAFSTSPGCTGRFAATYFCRTCGAVALFLKLILRLRKKVTAPDSTKAARSAIVSRRRSISLVLYDARRCHSRAGAQVDAIAEQRGPGVTTVEIRMNFLADRRLKNPNLAHLGHGLPRE